MVEPSTIQRTLQEDFFHVGVSTGQCASFEELHKTHHSHDKNPYKEHA